MLIEMIYVIALSKFCGNSPEKQMEGALHHA